VNTPKEVHVKTTLMNTSEKSATVLFLLTLGLCGYIGYGPKFIEVPEEESSQVEKETVAIDEPVFDWEELLKAQCQTLLATSHETNQRYANSSVAELEREMEERIREIRSDVPRLLDKLASLKGTTNLTWLMTKDKVSGTTEFPTYLEKRFRPTLEEPLLDLLSDMESGLLLLEDQLNTESTHLASEILTYAHTLPIKEDNTAESLFLEFRQNQQILQEQTAQISALTSAGVFGVSLTTVFLKPSMALARNVLGHIAGRMATATGIGTATSVADGPFPFGEAILVGLEVGGAVWSGYDLHKAQVVLKNDLRDQLDASLDKVESRLKQTLRTRIQETLEKHNVQNQQIVATLVEPKPTISHSTP